MQYIANEAIKAKKVLLVRDNGTKEELSIAAAKQEAADTELDLVQVSESNPPVCKIMDYNKYLYTSKKRQKENKKNQGVQETKEIKLSINIQEHDLQTKLNQSLTFLSKGFNVRVTLHFFGSREASHPELGYDMLNTFVTRIGEAGSVDKKPVQEGRNISIMVKPSKRVVG